MRIDVDAIEASRPGDREVALLASEVRRLRAVINSSEPTLTDEERDAVKWAAENAEDSAHKKLMGWPADEAVANTLRGLLKRLG